MMTHDEMIAVIQAHKDGKKIRSREIGSSKWFSGGTPNFDFHRCEFEVEPEPRSLWVVRDEQGRDKEIFWKLNNAETCVRVNTSWIIREYKEVLP